MLFVNLNSFNNQDYERVKEATEFLKNTDLTATPLGRSHQDGERFYVQTLEYTTESIDNFQFEIHNKRLDLHYIVEGEERIDVSPDTSYTGLAEYNSDRDIQYVQEPQNINQVLLHKGDFVLIGMHEPHRTNGFITKPSKVRKIVLKLGR
ncbi:YhcH/YjgK/YiaL family protein [Secundilactobacillus collinoides]|uniref:Yhch yjgk yial family protein n=1 Tax=Secundilactobacillus collinoides DSM 20515 = JCM 1123 TaxID=1423733 RepID=A0A0R2B955_SECCO|nr:YhcH/YjgK/YiaL family protein [Secundilactobacillus collinoides]KRM75074.1 yhch yjgk yial family protein [Secundilactobacillus collinoides DSM 20515 = JCM 1123]